MQDRDQQITKHLQREDVQNRLLESMRHARSGATVTISNAARLFGFTENQLRDWDEKGLLKPQRLLQEQTEDGKSSKRRQYTPAELDKLAIIRELINTGYAPGTIPSNIDEIWRSIVPSTELSTPGLEMDKNAARPTLIDQRVESTDEELFWRYFASQALRLSLMLIIEDIPDEKIAGLVLPLYKKEAFISVPQSTNLADVGGSLIGWLGRNLSFYTFLDSAPSFEFPTDFRIEALQAMEEEGPKDNTLIVMQRKAKSLNLSISLVETMRRLLTPLYEDVALLEQCFGRGMHDLVYPFTDFNRGNPSDIILSGLAEIVVHLDGRTNTGQNRWRFCDILLPNDPPNSPLLPLQRRSLVVRAQSKFGPHQVGVTTLAPHAHKPLIGLSLRAFQSGHIIYRRKITAEDPAIAHRELEEPIHSAIAVPVEGEGGIPLAVIYVASEQEDAFSENDRRLLRLIGRMVEELLLTYRVRQQVTGKLGEVIKQPDIVDTSFVEFLSENEFITDLEELLTGVKANMECEERKREEGEFATDLNTPIQRQQQSEVMASFIAIDIDNHSRLANKYGDRVMRNLSRAIGLRIQGQFRGIFRQHTDYQLYHIYADRYYLLLKAMPLDEAREKAERIRQALEGSYYIDAQRISPDQPTPAESMLDIPLVTTRLAVTSYTREKLEEVLRRYPATTNVAEVRAKIINALDEGLEKGRNEGGNAVISWNYDIKGFVRWSPTK